MKDNFFIAIAAVLMAALIAWGTYIQIWMWS